jgi:hypothetical protein
MQLLRDKSAGHILREGATLTQAKLAAFTENAPEPVKPAYSCWTCNLKLDIILQEGKQKVRCKSSGLRDFRENCSGWTDGKGSAHFPHAPEGFVPRSRA